MRFLFLEPFFGGSHRDFAEGLVAHSRHEIDLLTLPARFWKWRMRGAALYFAHQTAPVEGYDGLITTNLMSLSDYRALCRPACPPALVYFHENQLSYPLAPGESMDFQFGFTDITTALAADQILFNSHTHFKVFFSHLHGFLKMMPEYRPAWAAREIRSKAGVLYPGCRFPARETSSAGPDDTGAAPLIIWNHRWEFDKNPGEFFDALDAVSARGLEFRLALLGENFQTLPKPFVAAQRRYKDRLVHYGYVESKKAYCDWLRKGDIVISTAIQENFGISVVEAIRFGCLPLLPHRLAYPEILPKAFHSDFLYKGRAELVDKLSRLLSSCSRFRDQRQRLSAEMGRYSWQVLIDSYDEALDRLPSLV